MDSDPERVKAERIISWIHRQRSLFFTVRDFYRANQRIFKPVKSIKPTLKLLEQHGYIRVDRQGSSGGRPPSSLCEVNPALFKGTPL